MQLSESSVLRGSAGLTVGLEEPVGELAADEDVPPLGGLVQQTEHQPVHAADVVQLGRVHQLLVERDVCRSRAQGR